VEFVQGVHKKHWQALDQLIYFQKSIELEMLSSSYW